MYCIYIIMYIGMDYFIVACRGNLSQNPHLKSPINLLMNTELSIMDFHRGGRERSLNCGQGVGLFLMHMYEPKFAAVISVQSLP